MTELKMPTIIRTLLPLTLSLYPAFGWIEPAPQSRQIMWRAPKHLTVSDWIWGPGGAARAPRPPFRFVRENLGGTNPKVDVRDAAGALWIVKFGSEVHTDTFASRLLHATGYATEPIYFVPEGVISGVHGLKRAKWFVSKDGRFHSARFKLRDRRALEYADELQWSWVSNPFLGSHELNGLKILIMLTSNWDTKDARDGNGSNTAVFRDLSQPGTFLYSFTDWGASFGKSGGFFKRDKWDARGYERETKQFVKRTAGGQIVWRFKGKHTRDITNDITVDDIRWLLPHLSKITNQELLEGLIGSGANEAEAKSFSRSIQNRIAQLEEIADTNLIAERK